MIFRVFKCPHCAYIGYQPVRSEDEDSTCNICSRTITPISVMKHVETVEEARTVIQRMFIKSQRPAPKSRHGLGVRRRILNMVSDLSDLNRGRGVSRSRVLEECEGANIDLEKARRFLRQLEEGGLIIDMDGQLVVVEVDDRLQVEG